MPKVLIVNHDEDTMELIKMWLIKNGLEAKCTSEDEAISVMKEFKADVLLVDVNQIEAAKKIKQEKELANTPIVVMAGYTLILRDYTNIANEVIRKPFEPKEVVNKIRKVLK